MSKFNGNRFYILVCISVLFELFLQSNCQVPSGLLDRDLAVEVDSGDSSTAVNRIMLKYIWPETSQKYKEHFRKLLVDLTVFIFVVFCIFS